MSKINSSEFKVKLKIQINNLLTIYEQKAECGIFFKLNPDKSPLEILGVLNFLQDKIKKWGNTNIFSYHGSLFDGDYALIVGSRNLEEAISIIIYMYLSRITDTNYEDDIFLQKLETSIDLELFLRNHVSEHIEKGYPVNQSLESELSTHLDKLICKNPD
ncbi:MAG: hypothetical protein ACFFCE_15140 [Promethearchaeota archaeon]